MDLFYLIESTYSRGYSVFLIVVSDEKFLLVHGVYSTNLSKCQLDSNKYYNLKFVS